MGETGSATIDSTAAEAVGAVDAAMDAPWLAKRVAWFALNAGRFSVPRVLRPAYASKVKAAGGTYYTVESADGERLHCLHLPGDKTASDDAADRLTVFLMHGWIECKELHLFRVLPLQRAGHDVVMIDHRGHGGSTGTGITFGALERDDLRRVIDDAIERGIGTQRVITMGHSMGAATCLLHAADDARVAGVSAVAPFATIRGAIEAFQRRIPGVHHFYPRAWVDAGFRHELDRLGGSFDAARPVDGLGRIASPVLLIEGGRDSLTPPAEHSRRLFDAPGRGPMELVQVPQASHFTISKFNWPSVAERVSRLCADVSRAVAEGRDPAAAIDDGRVTVYRDGTIAAMRN
ncbi:MAG: alpha/beta fold hydrolase [Planctomycetota bacterium]